MKGLGVLLVLGLILCAVLLLASWLRTAHRSISKWPAPIDRGLDQVDGLAGLASSQR
jgi:hypothetical protein